MDKYTLATQKSFAFKSVEKPFRLLIFLLLTVAFLAALFLSKANAGPHLVLIPKVNFPVKEFDLGTVEEGIEVRHVFKIENLGKKTLKITTAFSTCGCTVPVIKKKRIEPGEYGELEVIVDTSMKQGEVIKPIEVRTNDPLNPVSTIYIKAKVIGPHENLGKDKTAKIFTGKCARCHVDEGKGKLGEDLYNADCAMCHGYRAKGIPAVAPTLIPFPWENKEFAGAMKQIISRGSKSHKSMPGYLKEAGGPLDEKEIDSIIDFLRKKSALEKKS